MKVEMWYKGQWIKLHLHVIPQDYTQYPKIILKTYLAFLVKPKNQTTFTLFKNIF